MKATMGCQMGLHSERDAALDRAEAAEKRVRELEAERAWPRFADKVRVALGHDSMTSAEAVIDHVAAIVKERDALLRYASVETDIRAACDAGKDEETEAAVFRVCEERDEAVAWQKAKQEWIDVATRTMQALTTKLGKLREALEWYASSVTWDASVQYAEKDGGARARAAIAASEEP